MWQLDNDITISDILSEQASSDNNIKEFVQQNPFPCDEEPLPLKMSNELAEKGDNKSEAEKSSDSDGYIAEKYILAAM